MSDGTALIILVGGRSSRMGCAKHDLRHGAERLLDVTSRRLGDLFEETLVVGGAAIAPPRGARWIPDRWIDCGPLGGLATGLSTMTVPWALVVGCDMPEIRRALVVFLLTRTAGADAVIPVVRGYDEPLLALYHRRCAPAADRLLGAGVRPVRALYERVNVRRIPEAALRGHDPDLASFTNLNSGVAWSAWRPRQAHGMPVASLGTSLQQRRELP
jgi:molybdopterin-guanine dinucleotide biosynthesis protein A